MTARAPENVRIRRVDGSTVALELRYEGFVDGAHQWAPTTPVIIGQGDRVLIDLMPPHTTIVLVAG